MRKRVVITGMGTINPLGNNVTETWDSVFNGRSGIGLTSHFDTSDVPDKVSAEVKGFDAAAALGRKDARRMDRVTQLSVFAANEALDGSGIEVTEANRDRIGAIIGSGIGGIQSFHMGVNMHNDRGPRSVSPFMIPMMLPDTPGGEVAIRFGIRGPNIGVSTACATGTNAIGEATEMIRRGAADVMLAGGAEAAIDPVIIAGFSRMGALTKSQDPATACTPFDLNRSGFTPGEGAAIVVLESEEHAKARGATIFGEVVGYALTNDAYHISAPAGYGAVTCMKLALNNAGLNTEQVQYINAHGTSTKLNDKTETEAVKEVFNGHANKLAISSTKSMHGHLLGGAGALEAIIAAGVLKNSVVPPTIGYTTPDPDCDLDYVPNEARDLRVDYILSNSFGFGGHNATLVIGKY